MPVTMQQASGARRCRRAGSECANRRAALPRAALTILLAMGFGPVFAAPLDEPIQPIPWSLKQDPARVDIGRLLFQDPRLSINGRVSCASCHDVKRGGADGRDHSLGMEGKATEVNTPTVFNAAFNFRQFWNGRSQSLEDQVDHVVRSPVEMGSKWDEIIQRVADDATYKRAFAAVYKDGITQANIQSALAAYERTLITPNSRFDQYLRGNADAITAAEKAGYAKFKQYGCVACHQGVNVRGAICSRSSESWATTSRSVATRRRRTWAATW